jgi:hypothetical protein
MQNSVCTRLFNRNVIISRPQITWTAFIYLNKYCKYISVTARIFHTSFNVSCGKALSHMAFEGKYMCRPMAEWYSTQSLSNCCKTTQDTLNTKMFPIQHVLIYQIQTSLWLKQEPCSHEWMCDFKLCWLKMFAHFNYSIFTVFNFHWKNV